MILFLMFYGILSLSNIMYKRKCKVATQVNWILHFHHIGKETGAIIYTRKLNEI